MPGLCLGRDGLIYACTGFDYDAHLVAYNLCERDQFLDFGLIYDPDIDAACFLRLTISVKARKGLFSSESLTIWTVRVIFGNAAQSAKAFFR